jgi:hypothetical protein
MSSVPAGGHGRDYYTANRRIDIDKLARFPIGEGKKQTIQEMNRVAGGNQG